MAGYNFIAETGVIVPDFADTLAQVESEYRQIEGFADIDLSPETPQGALMLREALLRDNVARNNANLANQINPDLSSGSFFDALFAFMGSERRSATFSIIRGVEMSGVPSTIIPSGSLAESPSGAFALLQTVTIPPSGTVTGDFQSVEAGAVAAPAGSLTTIASSVLGWETVTNPVKAEIGRTEESMFKARRRREQTLALQGSESVEAIISALYDLPDVNSLSYLENTKGTTEVIQGITMVSHSMYLCIDGGQPEEIARALKRVRGIGPAYNGTELYTITDELTGVDYPIRFDRPILKPFYVRVTVRPSSVNAQQVIPALVMTVLSGETPVDEGLTVGNSASPFEIASGINYLEPSLFVLGVEISEDNATWSSAVYPIAVNELGVTQAGSVSVVVA